MYRSVKIGDKATKLKPPCGGREPSTVPSGARSSVGSMLEGSASETANTPSGSSTSPSSGTTPGRKGDTVSQTIRIV